MRFPQLHSLVILPILALALFLAVSLSAEEAPEHAEFKAANKLMGEKKYAEALLRYKETLVKAPKSPNVLYNAGLAAYLSKEHKLAAQYFTTLKGIDATAFQVRAKLIQSLQAAGDSAARDAERAEFIKARKETKDDEWLKYDFYCRDQFEAGGKPVMVFEYFELKGDRALRYAFRVLNAEGKQDHYISLGSYEITNAIAREQGDAKGDARLFHLDGYYRNEKDHATFGFFNGEPSYDETKKAVLEILENKRRPMSSTTGGK